MITKLTYRPHVRVELPAETKLKLVMELARKISSSLDLSGVLDLIIDTVRSFIPYDSAGIYIIEGRGRQKRVVANTTRGYEDSNRCVNMKIGDGIIGWVVKTGNSAIVPDVSRDSRYILARSTTQSEIAAPIRINGRIVGAFNLESDQLNAYTRLDLEMLIFFANEAAICVEKAILHEALVEKKRMEAELAVAHQVQQSLLPKEPPNFGFYEIAGINCPTAEVGGDYFDYINVSPDRLGVVIADVAGKGVPAALIMASFRASLRAQVCNDCSLRRTFTQMNELLVQDNYTDQYVTACYIDLHRNLHNFSYINAGHNRPLLLHANGKHEVIDSANVVLGLLPNQPYNKFSHHVIPGDLLLLYTDGITEAAYEREEFGVERLVASAYRHYHLPVQDMLWAIYKDVQEFAADLSLEDDCTLVAIKVKD